MARRSWFGRANPSVKPLGLEARQYGVPLGRALTADGEVSRRNRISLDDRYGIYLENPFYRKGVIKHAGDLVREWVDVVDRDGSPVDALNDEWWAWTRDANLKRKVRDAVLQAHVFDNGILELVYDDDGNPGDPVPPGAVLVDVNPLPRKTTALTLIRLDDGGYTFGAKHRPFGSDVIKFHPDRVHAVEVHPNPEEAGGVSTAEAAYHLALSMIQGDSSLGDIIRHHGPGFKHARVMDDDAEAIKTLANIFAGKGPDGSGANQMLRGIATGGNVEVTNYDASGIDVAPYYEAMHIGIAAALGMPVDTLKGVQAGAVTGSETNRVDYQDALRESREMNLDHLIVRLMEGRFGAGDYRHEWRPFPTSPEHQARLFRDQAGGVEALVRAGVPLHLALREAGVEIMEDELPEPMAPDANGLFPLGS